MYVGSSINLDVVEVNIKSIADFDQNSMLMRYPIGKDLKANKKSERHFDFVRFGERMNELCSSLRTLDDDLSNQCTRRASPKELNDYLGMIEKYRSQIKDFLEMLEKESEEEFVGWSNLIDNLKSGRLSPALKDKFLKECEADLLILLDNLFYGGRSVNANEIRLAISPDCRQKEFVGFCYYLLKLNGLCFGSKPQEGQINIFLKCLPPFYLVFLQLYLY